MATDPWCPMERWEPFREDTPTVVLSAGPETVQLNDDPDLGDMPRSGRVGFTASR